VSDRIPPSPSGKPASPGGQLPTPDNTSAAETPLTNPALSWNADGLPVSQQFDDPYFSVDDGLNESRYVFLQHNDLPQRWRDWHGDFNILETGFGTGLNFLMTWQRFASSEKTSDTWLHFTSIEKYPLSHQQLAQAMALWPELEPLSQQLLQQYPLAVAGFHHLIWPQHKIRLTLIFDDVHNTLNKLSLPVHAWYLDGFAPSKNPEMWTDALFQQMRRLSNRHPNAETSVATFTAAGIVRRGLKGAGFEVKKVPGFGRKREMLSGYYRRTIGPEQPSCHREKPWLITAPVHRNPEQVVVLGAGLAGATTARALAERGIAVTLIDRLGIAQAASGNPQGGLYVKLAAGDNAIHTDFYLAAFQNSLRRIRSLLGSGSADGIWHDCGVLQLAYSDKEQQRQQKFLEAKHYPSELIHAVDAVQATELSGCPQTRGGLFFPEAGWVSPTLWCEQLVDHPLIRFEQRDIRTLQQTGQPQAQGWQLTDADGESISAQQLVIASAYDARQLLPDAYLPVKRIRGQLTVLDSSLVPDIRTVLCARAYMAPARQGMACLGATYNLNDDSTEVRSSDHLTNLSHLDDFGPAWHDLDPDAVIQGRVGFRCTTPDYLPMVGALPDVRRFVDAFAPMVRNAKQIPKRSAPVMPGLWLNIGHGSRGLASTPLCAELLAAQITDQGKPVGMDIEEALWPGRFLLRDMMRRRLTLKQQD